MSNDTAPLTAASFPRAPLIAVTSMVLAALVAVSAVRITGVGVVHVEDAPVLASRDFRFVDQADGSIAVLDGRDQHLLETVAPGTNGFLRGTMRGLARERHRRGIGPEQPFQMVGHADGRLVLEDPATGRRVDLGSFGPTNAAVFARLMSESLDRSSTNTGSSSSSSTRH